MLGSGKLSNQAPIEPVVEPGTFPPWMLEQTEIWIDTKGYAHKIDLLDEQSVLWALDYALANAKLIREKWSKEFKLPYNVSQRARRWMLDKPVIRALLRRLTLVEPAPEEVNKNADS